MSYKDPEKQKEYLKKYREQDKEKTKEKNREYQKRYRSKHKEKIKLRERKYYIQHPEIKKEYRDTHKEERKEKRRKYSKTEKGKILNQKHRHKRRQLGFIPLNEPFDGCHAHHINTTEVVYIPKELHQSYPHNHKKIETMVVINAAIVKWLRRDSIHPTT